MVLHPLLAEAAAAPEWRALLERLQAQLDDHFTAIDAEMRLLDEQIAQIAAQIDGIAAQNAAAAAELAIVQADLARMRDLDDQGLIRAAEITAQETAEVQLLGELGQFEAQSAELRGKIAEAEIRRLAVRTDAAELIQTELSRLRPERTRLLESRSRILADLGRLDIRAPVGGRILGSQVMGLRSVVVAAVPLMTIVPDALPVVARVRVRAQAEAAGAARVSARVARVARAGEGFRLSLAGGGEVGARRVIVATGVRNHAPRLPRARHDAAVAAGLLRYCPICDGREARGLRIGVLGEGAHALAEAAFIRTYSDDVTLIPADAGLRPGWPEPRVISARIAAGRAGGGRVAVFDTVYVALGTAARVDAVHGLGLRLSGDGCLVTDAAQETDVPGLHAAGDVTDALDQVAVAVGQGAVAATAVHNALRRAERRRSGA